jgi:hypothetical protein
MILAHPWRCFFCLPFVNDHDLYLSRMNIMCEIVGNNIFFESPFLMKLMCDHENIMVRK